MSKWKTYIVDDFTPFHGLSLGCINVYKKFNMTLSKKQIAILITDGVSVSDLNRQYKDKVLIDPTKKLTNENLKCDFKETFKFDEIKRICENNYHIDILEPEIYNPRKITV